MRIALLQMSGGIDPAANAATIVQAVADAKVGGAVMLFTPEVSGLVDRDRARAAANVHDEAGDPVLAAVRAAAVDHRLWVHLGSLLIRRADGKLANRGFVIDDAGTIRARYDKMHLFDVDLPTGESWRESASYTAGEGAFVVDTPAGILGLSICYDLRFPDLYRALTDAGATVMSVPAAFTRPTGAAHWHVLLRARAIEGASFVVAAAQTGVHEDGRATYGHSLVVDPWGEVVLDMGEAPGLGFADLDTVRQADVRARIPALRHRRGYSGRCPRMIVFDLKCGTGHVFETWFGSSADFADQQARGLVDCPICGDRSVEKAVMAPAVGAKGNRQAEVTPAAMKAAMAALAKAQSRALEGSQWVGTAFAGRARAMHAGEEDHAPIHGQATIAEAKALAEDGVPVAQLPLPVVPPDACN